MTSLSCFRSLRRTLSVLVVGSLATAGLLAATPTASSAVTTVAASAAASTGISVAGLTTNGRTDPLGIPGAAPSFGWKSSSERRGVTQTAYEIQVGSSAGADDVWSSGKVVSDEQADVAYAGPDLTSGTRYYWRVRVWDDQDTASDWSDPAWFETGLLTAADWGSAAWVGKPAPSYSSWTDYTVTESFKLNAVAFGTFLHATDVKNTYMWQINVGSTASATPQLVPHVEVNGTYTVLPAVDLTTFGFTRAGLLSGTHTVSYQLSGTTVTTTLDGVVVDTRTVATYGSGRVGIRTYGSESVTISQLKVVKADGTALADPSFAASNPLSGGSIANGAVTVSGTVDSLLTGAENNEPLLRKTFATTTGKTVESARVYASAHGVYQLSLNGHKVGDQFLAPGYTEYDKRIQSQTYDVTELLTPGEHELVATLTDGWYRGSVGFTREELSFGERIGLLAQLEIVDAGGATTVMATDGDWEVSTAGPIVAADLIEGERIDLRRPFPPADGWGPCDVFALPDGVATQEAQRRIERFRRDGHAVVAQAGGAEQRGLRPVARVAFAFAPRHVGVFQVVHDQAGTTDARRRGVGMQVAHVVGGEFLVFVEQASAEELRQSVARFKIA